MSHGHNQSFAKRLIQTLKDKGHTASRSPNGICIRTLAEFADASEQICRRYVRGDALPDYEKIIKIANHLQVSPGWLLFGEETAPQKENEMDERLLHYILKHTHHLYPTSHGMNDDYADFVIGLVKEIKAIDTTESNLLKIIDLAIGSISSYKERRKKLSHTV